MLRACLLLLVLSLSCAEYGLSPARAFVAEVAQPQNPRDVVRRKMLRDSRLQRLFLALQASPDPKLSNELAAQIIKIWSEPDSDTVKILLGRVQEALKKQDQKTALELLDKIIEIDPKFFQARLERSKIHFQNEDHFAAMIDLREVLRRESRHFDAIVGMGIILMNEGFDARALSALETALAIHPHLQAVPDIVRRLELKVRGLPI